MLAALRKTTIDTGFGRSFLPVLDVEIARSSFDSGDLDAAIALSRTNLDSCFETGWMMWTAPATEVLVEALLKRGGDGDLNDASKAVDTLATVPTDPGFVLNEPPLLHMRALLAQAAGDMTEYREYRDSYRNRATELDFEGHIAISEAMP
jgi:adenylate cyclase